MTLLTGAASADGAQVVSAWETWAAQREIASGQIVVLKDGNVVANGQLGNATGPVELASLSKAITGACVVALVQDGVMSWADSLGDYAPDIQKPLARVTLSELLTHSGGLWPDSTYGPMSGWRGEGDPV